MHTSNLCRALRFSLWLLLCGLPITHAQAAEDMDISLAIKGDVLSCDAKLAEPPEGMRLALSEGSEVSIEWEINVAIERKYWLSKSVASVQVNRHVIPDLVSRSWTLEDLTSGVSRRVFSLDEAIGFLTSLSGFPVVDSSLLTSGQAYVVSASLNEREGSGKENPWTSWFSAKGGSIITDFQMP